MKSLLITSLFISSLFILTQCSKKDCNCSSPSPNVLQTGRSKLLYADSIFYLKNAVYTISPAENRKGIYTAFPDNLQLDPNTGNITVAVNGNDGNSQTGLWYKITFQSSTSNETDSTFILLSGLNYVDKFYQLTQNDSIIYPIYNGDPSIALPAGNYDIQHDNDFAINPVNGQINIRECIRRGFFTKQTNASGWKKATIKYTINDRSNGALNSIELLLYYYHTLSEVPSNVSKLMQAHQSMTIGMRTATIPSTTGAIDNNLPSDLSLSKPRPPCVVIVGN